MIFIAPDGVGNVPEGLKGPACLECREVTLNSTSEVTFSGWGLSMGLSIPSPMIVASTFGAASAVAGTTTVHRGRLAQRNLRVTKSHAQTEQQFECGGVGMLYW